MDNTVTKASKEEGKALADIYKGGDIGKADKEVHDRLLQDAIKSHHSELDMSVVTKAMVDESAKLNDKRVHISAENYGVVQRSNELPVVQFFDKSKLYDPTEGWKAIQDDDKKREEAAKEAKDSGSKLPQINLFDGALGLPTLFKQINDAQNKQ